MSERQPSLQNWPTLAWPSLAAGGQVPMLEGFKLGRFRFMEGILYLLVVVQNGRPTLYTLTKFVFQPIKVSAII